MKHRLVCLECGMECAINNMSRHYKAKHPNVHYPAMAMHEQRFRQSFAKGADAECWQWSDVLDDDGYGKFAAFDRMWMAHRWAYEQANGEIPEGYVIDHLCRKRDCVNPRHLEAVPSKENLYRGDGLAVENSLRTHCPQGHPYEGVNLYVTSTGSRQCVTCRKERLRNWQESNREHCRAYERAWRAKRLAEGKPAH